MASLSLGYSVVVESPVAAFGFQKTPPLLRSVYASDVAGFAGFTLSGLRLVPEAGTVIQEPTPLWTGTKLTDWTFPTVAASAPGVTPPSYPMGPGDWAQGTSSETGAAQIMMTNAQPNADGSPKAWQAATNGSLSQGQSFYLRLSRGQIVTGQDPSGAQATPTDQNDYAVVQVGPDGGDGQGGTPFRLIFQRGRPAYLQSGNPDGSWPDFGAGGVAGTNVPDSNAFWQSTRVLQIEWLFVPAQNALIVTLGPGQEVLSYSPAAFTPADDPSTYGDGGVAYQNSAPFTPAAGSLLVYGAGGTAGLEVGGVGFSVTGYVQSPPIDTPFVYQGNGLVRLNGVPSDDLASVQTAVTTTDHSGTRIAYQIQVTGTDSGNGYDSESLSLTGWQLEVPPTFDYNATISVPSDISRYVSGIDENAALSWLAVDAQTQTPVIRSQVGLTLDNSYGGFTGYGGIHRAVQYSRWLRVQSDVTGLWEDYSPPIPFLTGWCGQDTSVYKADPQRRFDMVLDDGAYPLARVDIGYADPFDGWCPLAAIRFLALLSGRSDAFIADYMKTCDFGPDPPDCPHVKLPLGTATAPRLGFGPNRKYWDAMAEICGFYHALLFVDPNNILGATSYAQAVQSAPYKGSFDTQESGDPDSDDFLTSLWRSQTVRSDTADRRTGVAFFGIDPSVNTVQGTYLSADDFTYQGFTAEQHGFRDNLVAVSNLFVDPDFTGYYALQAIQRVTLPTVGVVSGACFLSGLWPMDAYGINPNFAGLIEPAGLILESIRSRFSVLHPEVFGSTLSGKWFPNAVATS